MEDIESLNFLYESLYVLGNIEMNYLREEKT